MCCSLVLVDRFFVFYRVSFLAAQRIVKRGVCYQNVCPPVLDLSVYHTRESRINGLRHRHSAPHDRTMFLVY